ncbi:MAG: hypothetical protein AAF385_17185, partial [Pseudomonadota bacterium]
QASEANPAPAIVLIPGSGELGPEGIVPPVNSPANEPSLSTISSFASAFYDAGYHTLQLGKPGVEHFSSWDKFMARDNFYNEEMWNALTWGDLIQNVQSAIDYLNSDPSVDSSQIYLLGHSEGSVIAIDAASEIQGIKGLFLMGLVGREISEVIGWIHHDSRIERLIRPIIDANGNGIVEAREARYWPHGAIFPPTAEDWDWEEKGSVPIATLEQLWKQDPTLTESASMAMWIGRYPFWNEFVGRTDMIGRAAALPLDLHVFTGRNDLNTWPSSAEKLKNQCAETGKSNCFVYIIPSLTHTFANLNETPAGPFQTVILDQGLGAVDRSFLDFLRLYALDQRD